MADTLENPVKEFIPYEYDDILIDVKNRFYKKGYTDVDNEGSNAFKLSSILSGVLSNLSFNANANIQEMILSSAFNENNIVKGAGFQGYERLKNISYQYEIKLQMLVDSSVNELDETVRPYLINKFDVFISNGNLYYYCGEPFTVHASNKQITENAPESFITIVVKEGILFPYTEIDYLKHIVKSYTEKDEIRTETSFEIPLDNIEEDGVELYVTYYDGNILWTDQKWEKSYSMLIEDIEDTKSFIVLEDINKGTYNIHWIFSGTGTPLREGSIIKANVLISAGSKGISNGNFSTTSKLYKIVPNYQILKVTGIDKESKEKIVRNAPRFNNSANRAVVRKDYVALSNRRSEVGKVAVWGSENEIPKYRKSGWFSYIPSYKTNNFAFDSVNNIYNRVVDSTYYLTDEEINKIFKYYKQFSIPSLKHESRQPLYVDFDYEIEIVAYNPNISVFKTNEEIFNSIKKYFNDYIEDFKGIYFHSNLITKINETTTYISGITCKTKYNILLSNINFDNSFGDDIHYRFIGHISYPYKYPFSGTNDLIFENLPMIDTPDFLGEGYDLVVDFSNEYLYDTQKTFDIKYNDIVCGKYIVVRGVEEYIRIELYVSNMDNVTPEHEISKNEWIASPLHYDMFNDFKKINLLYPNDNLSFYRNTIGRLNSVSFNIN